MENKIPFTTYDFWAYLSAGFLLLLAIDLATATNLLLRDEWTFVQVLIAVSAAYAVGQIVASLSSMIFERGLVGNVLGYPRDVLFGHAKAPAWLCALLPSYFQALPAETQAAALSRGMKVKVSSHGEALFWAAFSHARRNSAVLSRLENFLNLYGFCRNIALVSFLDAAILYFSSARVAGHLLWSLGALIVGIGMTFRYLKFYRLYASEVFTAYAYSEDD